MSFERSHETPRRPASCTTKTTAAVRSPSHMLAFITRTGRPARGSTRRTQTPVGGKVAKWRQRGSAFYVTLINVPLLNSSCISSEEWTRHCQWTLFLLGHHSPLALEVRALEEYPQGMHPSSIFPHHAIAHLTHGCEHIVTSLFVYAYPMQQASPKDKHESNKTIEFECG